MNISQELPFPFNDFTEENRIHIEITSKPYTSAPKMADSIDYDDLIEIPLSTSTMKAIDSSNHVDVNKISNNSESVGSKICSLNISPSNQISGSILAVDELLKCSTKIANSKITMPYVEDGLSSESDAYSPKISPTDSYNSNIKSNETIFNSTLMTAISKDIDNIRKAINGNREILNDPRAGLTFISSKHLDALKLSNDKDDNHKPNISTIGSCTNSVFPTASHIMGQFTDSNEFSFDLSKSKEIKKDINKFSSKEYESDEDTDKLLLKQYEHNGKIDIPELKEKNDLECEKKRKGKEVTVRHPDYPSVLIEGLLFRANYLGSTQLHSEVKPSRDTRMIQAQEAVGRVKAPDCESQPSVAVDLFVSAEKILVLNTNLSEIMMDHNLKTISYIADIGDILVLMARRISPAHQSSSETSQLQNKILCHVFESDEAQLIAQSIGNAFQIAYIEYLKANGIDDPNIFKEVDYQDVLNDQEILTDELKMFSNKDQHKKVIVPKQKGESLGVVIVESGWGSMLPTVVLANMNPNGPAARCGLLNIGNQIISVNDNSLVGLPLSTCQQIVKKCRSQTAVKLTVVSCPPVVEVHIRRPDAKYQLGFSVQNGVICSLLRGGIAERGGVRVGHHIIEINGVSVVAMSHEKIVNLLATAVGEIHLRTMPTSIFRLLTGQDTPHYI